MTSFRGSPAQERKGRKKNLLSSSSSIRSMKIDDSSVSTTGTGSLIQGGSGNVKGQVHGKRQGLGEGRSDLNVLTKEDILRIWQTERCVCMSVCLSVRVRNFLFSVHMRVCVTLTVTKTIT